MINPQGGSVCRLFTLNIGGPSRERANRLAEYLLQQDLDVIVLTETRLNVGTAALMDALNAWGYQACWSHPPIPGERGVALLSRSACKAGDVRNVRDHGHRLVVERVMLQSPLTLIGAYVPSRDGSELKILRKKRFLVELFDALSDSAHLERTVLMGDFNVISRDHIPRYPAFRSWEYDVMDRIGELGFVDVFSSLHPGKQAHSWIGRGGDGYRYDYAFVSQDLAETALECDYVHEVREAHLSDHAGVLLTLGSGGEPEMTRLKGLA